MRFGQHRHPRHAAIRREVVKVNVQERRTGDLDAAAKRGFDVL